MNKLINFFKENWIGAAIGGIIGFMNIGAEYVAKIPCPFKEFIIDIRCGCAFIHYSLGAIPPPHYTSLSIIILIILGAFIQSKIKGKS